MATMSPTYMMSSELPKGSFCSAHCCSYSQEPDGTKKMNIEFVVSSSEVADRLWEACRMLAHDLSKPVPKPPEHSKFEVMDG